MMPIKRKFETLKVNPESVLLRQLKPSDVGEHYIGWLNDPEINRFLEIRHSLPITTENTVKYVAYCETIHRHHWGIFVEDIHVGNISCSDYNHNYKWVDISNLIGEKEYQKTDLCKLALAGALEHLFSVGGFHRIQAGTYNVHFAGITLLTNLGLKKEGVLREAAIVNGKYVDYLKFGILKREWEARKKKPPKIKVMKHSWEV
jgi:[ribosomal protein S5]-alanine N-acetyltransferase